MRIFPAVLAAALVVPLAAAFTAAAAPPGPAAGNGARLRLVSPDGHVLVEQGTQRRVVRTAGHTYGSLDFATSAVAGPTYPLTITVRPPTGITPDVVVIFVVNTDDSRKYDRGFQISGTQARIHVPAGHYTIMADAVSAPTSPGGDEIDRFAFRTDVNVTDQGQTALLDATHATRNAYPSFDLPRPAVHPVNDLFYVVYDDRGQQAFEFELPQFFGLDVRTGITPGGQHGMLTSIDVTSLDSPASAAHPYGYYLTRVHRNAVIGDEHVAVSAAQLATVQTHYYGDGRDLQGDGGRFPEFPYFDPGEFVSSSTPGAPVVRAEYLYNPPGVTWQATEQQYLADGSADIPEVSLPRAFHAGQTYREDWFRGPLAPDAESQPGIGALDCQACRSASQMVLGITPYGDSDPTHIGELFGTRTPEQHVTVREDGSTVFDGDDAFYGKGAAVFGVTPGDHGYQVIANHNGVPDGAILSAHSRTEWDFRTSPHSEPNAPSGWGCAGARSCTVLPLLTVSTPLATSMTGTLAPGRSSVVVTVGHVRGATATAISGLTFAVGADGTPLVPQSVLPLDHGRFLVTVVTPDVATGTGITVQVHAVDADGGSVTQTTHTAYTVRNG